MAESYVELCNRALPRAGISKSIQTLDVDSRPVSVEQEQCQRHFRWVRDRVLRAFPWPFATTRKRLAPVAGWTRTDWAYGYAAPAGMVAARYVVQPGLRTPRPDQIPAHHIEANVNAAGEVVGKLIVTDQVDAELVYTPRVENPAVFDPDFEDAYCWLLASELATAIQKDSDRSLRAYQAYTVIVRDAAAAALNEQRLELQVMSSFEAARS